MAPKKRLLALPSRMDHEAEVITELEYRTFCDLMREALRQYIHNFKNARGITDEQMAALAEQKAEQWEAGRLARLENDRKRKAAAGVR